jgi:hypothetical protein
MDVSRPGAWCRGAGGEMWQISGAPWPPTGSARSASGLATPGGPKAGPRSMLLLGEADRGFHPVRADQVLERTDERPNRPDAEAPLDAERLHARL